MNSKTILTFLFILGCNCLYGQSQEDAEKALKKIKKIDEIQKLRNKYPNWYISIDKTILSDSLVFPHIINAKIGDIVMKQYYPKSPKFVLKVLKFDKEELCKVKYIYLNGKEYSKSEIDSIRTIIIKRYKEGETFESLAKEYTMDNNPTGDLNWFYKGVMVEKFDNAVRGRKKGELFTVDVEEKKWHYVVLKTHDNKIEKVIVSIMIKCRI